MSRVQLSLNVSDSGAAVAFCSRLSGTAPARPRSGAVCCYALQDKVRAHDPDGLAWEYYTVLEHRKTP